MHTKLLSVTLNPASSFSRTTVADVLTDSGVIDALPSSADVAIEKQAEWAAAISSSGFVPLAPSKRVIKLKGELFKTWLVVEILPFPSFRLPFHIADAVLFM